MASNTSILNNFSGLKFSTQQTVNNPQQYRNKMLQTRPDDYFISDKERDRLRDDSLVTKAKVHLENVINTPEYAYRGLKGDADFNFYELQRVSKIPYYIGGITLAAIALAGRNVHDNNSIRLNSAFFKTVASGVVMYYVAKEVASAVIDIPVKLFRGVNLNRMYKKVTSLREGNPLNLPNNKKQGTQSVFDSTEFTRWDLLYNYNDKENMNERFDKLAKKFGAKGKLKDSDSVLMSKIKDLMIMATSWKYMLAVPFVTMGLGMVQQDSFKNVNIKNVLSDTINLLKPSTPYRFRNLATGIKSGILIPLKDSFKELWKGHSTTSKILGKTVIGSAIGLSILANAMILNKTSLRNEEIVSKGEQ